MFPNMFEGRLSGVLEDYERCDKDGCFAYMEALGRRWCLAMIGWAIDDRYEVSVQLLLKRKGFHVKEPHREGV
jgi:hypothetical protein